MNSTDIRSTGIGSGTDRSQNKTLLVVALTAAAGVAVLALATGNLRGIDLVALEFFCIAAAAAEIPRVTVPGKSVTL